MLLLLVMFMYIYFVANKDAAGTSNNQEMHDSAADSSSLSLVPEIGNSAFGVSPANIPRDQMRLIDNINALISEVACDLVKF